jgi:hypothetical protein
MLSEGRHTPGTWPMAYSGHQAWSGVRSISRRMPGMAWPPPPMAPVPAPPGRVAVAACPTGPPSLPLRDPLGTIVPDGDGATLWPAWGEPGRPPWRRARITRMPCRATLAERPAAEAVRARLAGPSRRGLERTAAGCDVAVRRAWRDRRRAGTADAVLWAPLLARGRP